PAAANRPAANAPAATAARPAGADTLPAPDPAFTPAMSPPRSPAEQLPTVQQTANTHARILLATAATLHEAREATANGWCRSAQPAGTHRSRRVTRSTSSRVRATASSGTGWGL